MELKKYNIRESWQAVLILFCSFYVGLGLAIFEIYSSDFYAFNPPFNSPILNSVLLPCLVLIIPTIILGIIFILLNLISKKVSSVFLICIITVCLLLYFLRVNYLLNPGYEMPYTVLGFIVVAVFIIVLILNRFIFTFFQLLSLIAIPLTLYFCSEYYTFLEKNRTDKSIKQNYLNNIGNLDNPIFFIIFDELSSFLLLDQNNDIDVELFPQLKEFSKSSTWYPNATTQVSETITTISSLFSGYDYFKDCNNNTKDCENSIINAVTEGKIPTLDIRKLGGIDSITNKMDSWNVSIKFDALHVSDNHKIHTNEIESLIYRRYGSQYKNITIYIKSIIDLYIKYVLNPKWSFKIFGVDIYADLSNSKHAKGAIVEGLPESPGFLLCATNTDMEIKRFNMFIDRIDPDSFKINSMHTSLTHTPFCFDTDGPVEVVYPIREIIDNYGKAHLLPDSVTTEEYTQSSCIDDEVAFNVRRSRINQTMLAMNLFNKAINKIKKLGIYDKSLIVAVSDHGIGFLGPSLGRGNHMRRKKEDILDNRMMNASILLLIKYPYQNLAEVDYRMVRPIDVAATVFDMLEFKPTWRIDGQSFVSPDWHNLNPPIDFFQILYKDNKWRGRFSEGIYVAGEIIEPTVYYRKFKNRVNNIEVSESKWIGRVASALPLSGEKSGELEYLKIEKALPTENEGNYVLTLGGHSYNPNLNPSSKTYIAVNNKIIKSIKPCLSFSKNQHKMGDIPGGWVITVPREVINSRKLNFRAFSPVENSEDELFYELENPINIELTEEQFLKVGNKS